MRPQPAFYAPHFTPPERHPPVLARLRAFRTNPLSAIPAAAYRGTIVSERLGPARWHILSSPEAFEHVFKDNLSNYPKARLMHRMLAPYLGEGILLAENEAWTWQRRALAPVFAGAALRQMAQGMQTAADRTVNRLMRKADAHSVVQTSSEMRVTAMDMVRQTMFSGLADMVSGLRAKGVQAPDPDHLGAYRARVQGSLDRFLQDFGRPGIGDILGLPKWCRPSRLWRRPPTEAPRRLLERLIAERRAARLGQFNPLASDMLDMMLDAADPETGAAMTDAEVRDNLLTFIITGSDTTALGLTWAIYCLTQSPSWANRLRAEADFAYGRAQAPDVLDHLTLTRAFVEEVLRLFPAASLVVRRAVDKDVVLGQSIRRGDLVLAPIYTLHRHPNVWRDPLLFDPNRFLGTRPDRFAYLPFGAGRRACIGAGFAMMELQLTIATMVRAFDFQLAPDWDVQPLMMLTLKPDGGLPIIVKRREARSSRAPLHAATA